MNRTPVSSSNLASVGYDAEREILEVKFKSGAIYSYKRVPKSIYEALMKAPSKGKFLNSRIKGKYSFVKMAS
jgi:hypothetical protein